MIPRKTENTSAPPQSPRARASLKSMLLRVRKKISARRGEDLRRFLNTRFKTSQAIVGKILFGSNLDVLALINDTDKNTGHHYTLHYSRIFAPYRKQAVKLLEIGIGGYAKGNYSDPRLGGGSLRMWRTYFPKGRIFGIDIEDKTPHNERRIKTFKGSQADTEFLSEVLRETGPLDIVIDDGSHVCDHVIASFEFLFPRMSESGLYVIEDTHTSYWPEYGGSSNNPDEESTTVGYFKRVIHGINHSELLERKGEPSYFERNILGISFYHNMIVVEKGPNTEGGAEWRVKPSRPE